MLSHIMTVRASKAENFTWMQYTDPCKYHKFPQSCSLSHLIASFNLEQFFILPLSFMISACFKTTGHSLYRIFLHLSVV